jgi:hypothetical protein
METLTETYQQETSAFAPAVPQTLEETGLSESMVQQLMLRILYFRGDITGRELSRVLGLNYSVIDESIEFFKQQHFISVKKSMGMGNVSSTLSLSEAGRQLAIKYLEGCQYAGTAPVPVKQYAPAVLAQRQPGNWLTLDMLRKAYAHAVVSHETLLQIGPAVNGGQSLLLYGQPGNGKTFMAEALFNIQSTPIYMPYALEFQGQIIQLYDPIYHHRLDDDDGGEASIWQVADEDVFDRRWFRCKRPFLVTGGELTLEMLDLSYNTNSKVYDAPFQLKANNGIYLIDDFGRQRVTPAEVLNRWIVPMERRVDFYNFQSGGKMMVPFEAFLVFSTNLRPDQLGDEAFLRRLQYKLFVKSPEKSEFLSLFQRQCRAESLTLESPTQVAKFVEEHYERTGKIMRRCHPRDVLRHAKDIIQFEQLEPMVTMQLLQRAFESTFVSDEYEK